MAVSQSSVPLQNTATTMRRSSSEPPRGRSLERGAPADCGAGRKLFVLLLLQRDERSMRTQFFECRVLRIVELWILERAQIVTEMLDRIRSHYDAVDPGP